MFCRTLGVFTDDGSIRLATDEERLAFLISDMDEQIKRAVQIARLFNATFGRDM